MLLLRAPYSLTSWYSIVAIRTAEGLSRRPHRLALPVLTGRHIGGAPVRQIWMCGDAVHMVLVCAQGWHSVAEAKAAGISGRLSMRMPTLYLHTCRPARSGHEWQTPACRRPRTSPPAATGSWRASMMSTHTPPSCLGKWSDLTGQPYWVLAHRISFLILYAAFHALRFGRSIWRKEHCQRHG